MDTQRVPVREHGSAVTANALEYPRNHILRFGNEVFRRAARFVVAELGRIEDRRAAEAGVNRRDLNACVLELVSKRIAKPAQAELPLLFLLLSMKMKS